jgi:tetratricopeptide (TPR) repeat protein
LWKAPVIEGLTESLAGLSEAQRNLALKRLENAKLLTVNRDESSQLLSLDSHPLIREYFATQLKTKQPDAWQAGHKRLYEYLRDSTKEGDQPNLEDLQPLYQAVAHGCQAGLQQRACEEIFCDRIRRRVEFYSTKKLGAYGCDLKAIACFFEAQWTCISSKINESWQAWLLGEAALSLHALGRLTEALQPMRAGLDRFKAQKDWTDAAACASDLSQMKLAAGAVAPAIEDAEQSVVYADCSHDAFERIRARTTHAAALHQAGRRAEAEARFREAEQMHAERQPHYPLLYSIQGFRYCGLLVDAAERAAWRLMSEETREGISVRELLAECSTVSDRGAKMFEWRQADEAVFTIGIEHLLLGRVALYSALFSSASPLFSTAANHLSEAVSALRRAGMQDVLPHGLLSRAWCSFAQASAMRQHGPDQEAADFVTHAQADLDEAWDIAARGPMRLFMADIHLYRARLFWREKEYPWESPATDLAAARELIKKCGYWRRKEELEDADALVGAGR